MIREELRDLRSTVRRMSMRPVDKRAIFAQIEHELENVHTFDFHNLQAFRQSLGVEIGSPWDSRYFMSRTM